jgi:hypothetical protein
MLTEVDFLYLAGACAAVEVVDLCLVDLEDFSYGRPPV